MTFIEQCKSYKVYSAFVVIKYSAEI